MGNLKSPLVMKTILKKITPAIVLIALLSFTIETAPITVDSIRNAFLNNLFDTYVPQDTTFSFTGKDKYSGDFEKFYAYSKCGESPGFAAYSFYEGLDTSYSDFGPEVVTRFKTLFGQDIVKSRLKLAAKDYEGNSIQWIQFNGLGIKAAFDKLYQKPTGKFQGIGLQNLYNFTLKSYVRDVTSIVVKVASNKPAFEALSKQYMASALKDPEFYGPTFSEDAAEKLGTNSLDQECTDASRVVGTLLRRQCDGSLPVLLLCLKTVLKDYDPEYYNKVALKF